MKREVVAKYLRDYAELLNIVRLNPDESILNNFKKINNDDNYDESYLMTMIGVFLFYSELRAFSYYKDLQLFRERLSKKSIVKIDTMDQNEFSFNSGKMDQKEFISMIRNCFNHYSDTTTFEIADDAGSITFYDKAKDGREFSVKMTYGEILDFHEDILKSGRNFLGSYFVFGNLEEASSNFSSFLDNVVFKHYDFVDSVPKELIEDLALEYQNGFASSEDKNKCFLRFEKKLLESGFNFKKINLTIDDNTLFSSDNLGYQNRILYLKLTDDQKAKFNHLSSKEIKNLYETFPDFFESILHYNLAKTIPFGMHHYEQVMYENILANLYISDCEMKFSDISKCLRDILSCDNKTYFNLAEREQALVDSLRVFGNENSNKLTLSLLSSDNECREFYPYMMYLDFMLETVQKDLDKNPKEEVVLLSSGEIFTKNDLRHLRNAVSHGRWYFGAKEEIHFFDAKRNQENLEVYKYEKTLKRDAILELGDVLYSELFNKKEKENNAGNQRK